MRLIIPVYFSQPESRNPTHTRLLNKITHIRGRGYLSEAEEKTSALSQRDGGRGGVADDDVRKASLGMGGCGEAEPY